MTAFTRGLYYPFIDIDNDGWLKNAILYWDQLQTIVPRSIERPYTGATALEFFENGLLEPLFVESHMHEIEGLTGDVLTYLNSAEGVSVLTYSEGSRYHHIHPEKLPREVGRLLRLHPEKLSNEIRYTIERQLSTRYRDGWLHVDERFGNFYMTLLATRLAEKRGLGLLTDTPVCDRLANAAKLNADFSILKLGPRQRPFEFPRYYEDILHQDAPITLAQGALANLVIKNVQIDPETTVEKILEFKEKHSDELGLFRSKIAELTSAISDEQPFEGLMQRVNDIYTNEVRPELNNFKKALKSSRIKWIAENWFKVSFFSTSATSVPLALAGLSVPQALLVGAGVSLAVSTVMYNCDKTEKLAQNPYTYVLAAEKHLI